MAASDLFLLKIWQLLHIFSKKCIHTLRTGIFFVTTVQKFTKKENTDQWTHVSENTENSCAGMD
jgi:hypothetical protein